MKNEVIYPARNKAIGLLILLIILLAGWVKWIVDYGTFSWSAPVIVIIAAQYLLAVRNIFLGRKMFWSYFDSRDKVIFVLNLILVQVMAYLPAILDAPWGILLLTFSIACLIFWGTSYLWGSEAMKKEMLLIKR